MSEPNQVPDWAYDDLNDEPEDDDDFDECGMTSDGTCMLAGSEWCDWDCPLDKLRRRRDLTDSHDINRKPTPEGK